MGKYRTITIGIKRDIRLEKWNVSQCSAQLVYELDPEQDFELAYKEVHEDVSIIVGEMIDEEKKLFREAKQDAIDRKLRKLEDREGA